MVYVGGLLSHMHIQFPQKTYPSLGFLEWASPLIPELSKQSLIEGWIAQQPNLKRSFSGPHPSYKRTRGVERVANW